MKKVDKLEDEVREGYSKEDFPGGLTRGKYVERLRQSSNIVRIRPDLSKHFPNEDAVNDALQSLLDIQRKAR